VSNSQIFELESGGRRSTYQLVKHHHLGHESIDVAPMRETASPTDCTEVLVDITEIIWLVKTLRKEFEEPFIVWPVTPLDRIHNDETPIGLDYASELTEAIAACLRRQFMALSLVPRGSSLASQ
jgi:hypothetical protein